VASVLILLHYRKLLAEDKSGDASQGCWPYGQDLLVVGIVRYKIFSVVMVASLTDWYQSATMQRQQQIRSLQNSAFFPRADLGS